MVFFRIPAPTITSDAYEKRLRGKCQDAISAGAVDAGTGAMFDRQIDADLDNDQAMVNDQARRYGQRAERVRQRHQSRREKAARRVADVADTLTEEETKRGDLDKQIEARWGPAAAGPNEERPERTRRLRDRLRNVGDSPFAVMFGWLMLILLLCVDVPVLHSMLGRADISSTGFTNWVIAAACAVVLAAAAGYACELLLRWIDHRKQVDGIFACVLYVSWAVGIGVSTWFRFDRPSQSGGGDKSILTSGSAPAAGQSETAAGAGGVGLSLLLSVLLLLTGVVAMGIVVFNHDSLQKQRRTSARRRWRLRWLLRHTRHLENRHEKAAMMQQTVIDGIEGQATDAAKQVFHKAVSLKEDVRHWMANAIGDPAATSALMDHPDDGAPGT